MGNSLTLSLIGLYSITNPKCLGPSISKPLGILNCLRPLNPTTDTLLLSFKTVFVIGSPVFASSPYFQDPLTIFLSQPLEDLRHQLPGMYSHEQSLQYLFLDLRIRLAIPCKTPYYILKLST